MAAELASERGPVGILLNSDKDYPPTRFSSKLNLRDPSVHVQAACPTSPVALPPTGATRLPAPCARRAARGTSCGPQPRAGPARTAFACFTPPPPLRPPHSTIAHAALFRPAGRATARDPSPENGVLQVTFILPPPSHAARSTGGRPRKRRPTSQLDYLLSARATAREEVAQKGTTRAG